MTFPPSADTPRKQLEFALRRQRRLIQWHNKRRSRYPTVMSPYQLEEFRKWEAETWKPKLERCNKLVEQCRSGFGPGEVQAIKEAQINDTTWDDEIDLEAI